MKYKSRVAQIHYYKHDKLDIMEGVAVEAKVGRWGCGAVEVGPWGPKTAETWSTEIFTYLKNITVYSDGNRICGIQFTYCIGCKCYTTIVFGSSTGKEEYSFDFKYDEYLTEINGEYDGTSLTALTFVTNMGTYRVPGIAGTGNFCLPIRQGGFFVGFFGYATCAYVIAIGAYLKPRAYLKPN